MKIIESAALPSLTAHDLAIIFNAVPSACLVVSPDMTIVAINDAHLESSRAVRSQVLGRHIFDAFPDNPAEPDADGSAKVGASIRRVLSTRATDEMPVQRYDVPTGSEGAGEFVVRYWKPRHVPVLNSHGEVVYVVQNVENVTQKLLDAASVAHLEHEVSAQSKQIHNQRFITELFQQAPAFMVMLMGSTHRVEFVNDAFCELIGNRDIVGLTIAQALPNAAAEGLVGRLDEVFAGGKPYSANAARFAEQMAVGDTVDERFLDVIYQPIRDPYGNVTGTLVQGIDVTNRVNAETRRSVLLKLAELATTLTTQADVGYQAAAILGEALHISSVSYGTIDTVAETLTVGRDWSAKGVETLAGIHPLRDLGSFIDDLKGGKFVAINNVSVDPRAKSAASSLMERSGGAFVNVPVMEDGKLVAVILVNNAQTRNWSTDDLELIKDVAGWTRVVSERLRSETALRVSEAKFRTIADAMPQMVWSTLPNGDHDYFNQQWYDFTGLAHGSSDGDGWNRVFHPEDQERARGRWHESLTTGEQYEIQYRLRHFSGQYRWVLGRALPICDESGRVVRWMGTCTDIHLQKLAEDELHQESRRKDEFLAMLAHELRNPLAPISTAAQIVALPGVDQGRITQASGIITRQVKHMTDLIDDLLDVSRVSRGLIEMARDELDVKAIIASAVEQAHPLLESRHHELVLRLPSEHASILGDRTRIVQAVANLLNNAAKYTPQGGKIALNLEAKDRQVTISVADNGIGIAPDLLPRVFDLFTQAERTSDRAQGGLGLGLTLVKSIAILHGGAVEAISGGNGEGSTFTIILPLIESTRGRTDLPAAEKGLEPMPVLRVVVVDDNKDAAVALSSLLGSAGHEVFVYEDARSALAADLEFAVDVFILDIGLPDMDGYELARRLRAQPRTANALLIALTGYGQAHDRILSKAAGFDHHYVKPLDYANLSRVLARVQPHTRP